MYIYVDIYELEQFETAPCDVFIYLPKNEKFVNYIKKGENLNKLKLLTEKNIEKIYVDFEFLNDFLNIRKVFTLDACNSFYKDYLKDKNNAVQIAKTYINNILEAEELINFIKLKTFTCNLITIVNQDKYSKLYFALNHISPFEGIKHSQKVSALALSIAILKSSIEIKDLIKLAFTALMHETPMILSKDINQIVNLSDCQKYPMEFKKLYFDIGIPSKILEGLNSYHCNEEEKNKDHEKDNEINNLILRTDLVIHKNIEKVEDALSMI